VQTTTVSESVALSLLFHSVMNNPNLGTELKNEGYSKEEEYFARLDAERIRDSKRVSQSKLVSKNEPVDQQNSLVRFLKRFFSPN
jgi:hypothetical protein